MISDLNAYLDALIEGQKIGELKMEDKACKVFREMLVELCPELQGYGAMAVEWENEFRKRLEK